MSGVEIRTDRLSLRPPRLDDLDRCAELPGDYEVARMLSRVSYPYDLEQGRAYLIKSAERWQNLEEADELGFHFDLDGGMIGGIGFKKLRETPEIGYWLGRPYWGKGFMSEGLKAAIAWLFQNTAHKYIACEAMTDNPASLMWRKNSVSGKLLRWVVQASPGVEQYRRSGWSWPGKPF